MRPLLVGESNPHSSDPRSALFPWPPGTAGSNLAIMLGMRQYDFAAAFERINLINPHRHGWDTKRARAMARTILTRQDAPEVIIMLGTRVSAAFCPVLPPLWGKRKVGRVHDGKVVTLIRIPHPSGRNRVWNEKRARTRLRRLLYPYIRQFVEA